MIFILVEKTFDFNKLFRTFISLTLLFMPSTVCWSRSHLKDALSDHCTSSKLRLVRTFVLNFVLINLIVFPIDWIFDFASIFTHPTTCECPSQTVYTSLLLNRSLSIWKIQARQDISGYTVSHCVLWIGRKVLTCQAERPPRPSWGRLFDRSRTLWGWEQTPDRPPGGDAACRQGWSLSSGASCRCCCCCCCLTF